jgi:hypothetical protein
MILEKRGMNKLYIGSRGTFFMLPAAFLKNNISLILGLYDSDKTKAI